MPEPLLKERGGPILPARQRGQALVFIAITTVVVLLSVMMLFSMGQLATQKMKLQNTADAAAYSAAIVEARDYNFSAYLNRAMVANQVAVAQFVGLTSWARNLDKTYNGELKSVPGIFSSFSGFKAMWDIPWNIAQGVASGVKSALEGFANALVPILDGLMTIMSGAEQVYHLATAVAVPITVNEVIQKNDPDASLTTAGYAFLIGKHLVLDWLGFTEKLDPTVANQDSAGTSYKDRFANVTLDSTDNFHKFRGLPGITPSLVDPTKFIPYNFGTALMNMYHTGGTELKNSFKTWSAMDVTGLCVLMMFWASVLGIPIPIPIGPCYTTPPLIGLPQGRGAAQTGENSNLQPNNNFRHNFAEAYGSAFVIPIPLFATAWKVGEGPGSAIDGGGLKSYYDVKKRGDPSNADNQSLNGPEIIIEVQKLSNAIVISSSNPFNVGRDGGQLFLADGTQNNRIKALSKAHAYFARPKKLFPRTIDSKTEYGSLYSPYWQARLLPNSLAEQAISVAASAF